MKDRISAVAWISRFTDTAKAAREGAMLFKHGGHHSFFASCRNASSTPQAAKPAAG